MSQAPRSLTLALLLLAGCAGGGGGGGGPGDDVPALQATETTGVIRAVVVDEAIRPVANATVTVSHAGQVVATGTTDGNGFAGFQDLAPGGYFVEAAKARFATTQQLVEVVAGVDDPPVARLLLTAITEDLPFYQEYKFEAFMECSALVGNWCFIANYYPCYAAQQAGQPCTGNLTNDNSYFQVIISDLQRVPDWLQGEMAWEPTQAVSPYMNFRIDIIDDTFLIVDAEEETGASPLLVVFPPERFVNDTNDPPTNLGVTHDIALEAFHGGVPAACDSDERLCFAGASVEQRFTYFLHVFYGYAPPEGWRFSDGGAVPPPPF